MMETKKIVLATHNQGKIREFQKAFAEIGWQAVPIADIAEVEDPEETGTTFEENALQKARCYAKAVDLPVLSDDSGIIACALGDRPGVYSARYGGDCCHSDEERTALLLKNMENKSDRRAMFVSCIACVFPNGEIITARGECYGVITHEPRGQGGFGYDPVFEFPETGKTMAELSHEEKNAVSHRGQALKNFEMKLREYYAHK